MDKIIIFHPAGLGDCLLDLANLYQLVSSNHFTKRIEYYCNHSVKPIIKLSGLDRYLDIVYLYWPILDIRDLFQLSRLRKKKQKIFVLSGMNLKRVGYLKYLWSNEVELFGTIEHYPIECLNRITPNDNTYTYIEGPLPNCHRIVQNFKLFKNQGLLVDDDFSLNRFDQNIKSRFDSIDSGLKKEPYIVIHTSQLGLNAKKTMYVNYWRDFLNILAKQFDKKIIIIGSSLEKMNVESMLSAKNKNLIINACGKTNLYEVISIIEGSEIVLAVDGGMAHLAAALGKKLITIFGPTNPFNVSPVGTEGIIITNPIECSPCYETKKYFSCPYNRKCLNGIDHSLLIELMMDIMAGVHIDKKIVNNYHINKIPDYKYLKSLI